ncbi:MAG: hypothetical protein BWX67_00821 [Thermotogae bacterium ADurb.Bin062]|mgnify:CR=1 FL=1|jgi:hypothetical protein|nr:MAG: hypothetical protein BWX67_00821 [Thermotogota bacterium ADurb.Bin062]
MENEDTCQKTASKTPNEPREYPFPPKEPNKNTQNVDFLL